MKAVKMIAALGTAAVLCASVVVAKLMQDTVSSGVFIEQMDTQNTTDTETVEDELLSRKKMGKTTVHSNSAVQKQPETSFLFWLMKQK